MTNLIVISGNIGNEPTLKFAKDIPFLVFSLAHTERFFDKSANEWKDGSTSWFDVAQFGKEAETLIDSLDKGTSVVVVGSVKVENWAIDGKKGTSIKIKAESVTVKIRTSKPVSKPVVDGENPNW